MLNDCCFTNGTRLTVPGHGEMDVVPVYQFIIRVRDGVLVETKTQVLASNDYYLESPEFPCGRSLIKRSFS